MFFPWLKQSRGVRLGLNQITHARKHIDAGLRREDVAALLNVNRTTLYRALATEEDSGIGFVQFENAPGKRVRNRS